jgi:hypothetical protein
MNFIHSSALLRNHISTITEASGPIAQFPAVPTTAAGRHLFRRHSISANVADLIASLAGLGIDEAPQ